MDARRDEPSAMSVVGEQVDRIRKGVDGDERPVRGETSLERGDENLEKHIRQVGHLQLISNPPPFDRHASWASKARVRGRERAHGRESRENDKDPVETPAAMFAPVAHAAQFVLLLEIFIFLFTYH